MKRTKGLLALGLCAAMLFPAAACGGGDEQGQIELVFWTTADTVNSAVNQKIVNDFNEAHKGTVKVNYVGQGAGYSNNLSSTLQGSRVPDILQIGEKYFKGFGDGSYQTGSCSNYTDKEKEYLKKFYKALAAKFHPDVLEGDYGPMHLVNKLKEQWGI